MLAAASVARLNAGVEFRLDHRLSLTRARCRLGTAISDFLDIFDHFLANFCPPITPFKSLNVNLKIIFWSFWYFCRGTSICRDHRRDVLGRCVLWTSRPLPPIFPP